MIKKNQRAKYTNNKDGNDDDKEDLEDLMSLLMDSHIMITDLKQKNCINDNNNNNNNNNKEKEVDDDDGMDVIDGRLLHIINRMITALEEKYAESGIKNKSIEFITSFLNSTKKVTGCINVFTDIILIVETELLSS